MIFCARQNNVHGMSYGPCRGGFLIFTTISTVMKRNGIRCRGFMVFYFITAIIFSVAAVWTTQLRGALGEAAYYGDSNTLLKLLGLLTAIAVVRAANAFVRSYYRARFEANAGFNLREHFMKYFLRIPFTTFEKAGSGESLSIFQNDLRWARLLVGWAIWDLLEDLIYLVAIFTFMFTISAFLTVILIATIPVLAVLQMMSSIPIQKRQTVMSEERANFNAVVNDSLQNISTIASYSLEEVLEERYLTAYDKFFAAFKRFMLILLPLLSFGFVGAGIPLSVINVLAAFRVINGDVSIADFIAFTTITLLTVEWVASLAERFNSLQTGVANAKRLLDSTSQELEDVESGEAINRETPVSISFNNVSFKYNEDGPLAVDSATFSIKPGSRVAFVGGSGSGKSTLLKLIMGLYTPVSGEILLSGENMANLFKSGVRDVFAYVPQDSFLFPESIGQNITLESTVSDMARLEKAASDAGILDFVKSLPDKWDSVLQEASENVSGGQRQRIAVARAFYKNAPVILFDEATSALDPTTEAAILKSFENVARGKTVIMVAHRPSAIAACDEIIVMDGGRICGIGTHDELIASSETYKNLYESRQEVA